jgi:hypothetical protein
VKEALLENVRLNKKELSQAFKLSIRSIFNILRHELNMTKVSARCWLRINNMCVFSIASYFLPLVMMALMVSFKKIVTDDETWVHHYGSESKSVPPFRKFKATQWSWSQSIGIEKGYSWLITKLCIKEKLCGKLIKGVLLLHDNEPVYTVIITMRKSKIHPILWIWPPISKFEELRERRFNDNDDLNAAVN